MRQWSAIVLATALCALLVAAPVHAESVGTSQPEQLGFSPVRLKRLTDFFQAEVAGGKVPGAILLVQRRGKPAYYETFGVRNLATRAPMTTDTLFRVYSMSKPITSVTAMMLVQEGKILLDDPVSKFIPSFAQSRVGVERTGDDGKPVLDLVPQRKQMTVQDLLRHTSGITYSFSGRGLVYQQYQEARFENTRVPNQEFVDKVAALPLSQQPGTTWEYSHSTDVLGRVIEVVEGKPLIEVMKKRLFDPLGMKNTSFYVTDTARQAFIAEPLQTPADGGTGAAAMFDPRVERPWQSGGGGLVSTVADYARFAQMITNGGTLDGKQYLSPKIFAWMTANHIGPATGISTGTNYLPGPGFGFGLGFAVRLDQGSNFLPGSVGELNWGGAGGTYFWSDPKEEMFVVMMIQSYAQRMRYRNMIKTLVYSAMDK